MRSCSILLGLLWLTQLTIFAQEDLTIVSYNILRFPAASDEFRSSEFRTIMHELQPDIMLLQEMRRDDGADTLINKLNTLGVDYYERAPEFFSYANLGNMLIYNTNKIGFISQTEVQASPRPLSHYKLWVKDPNLACHEDTTFLEVISVHLKAGSSDDNRVIRGAAAVDLMNYLDALPAESNIVVGGDCNFYDVDEVAYIEFTQTPHNHSLIDPLGGWERNEFNFNQTYTQSTRSGTYPGGYGGVTGGTDDRFDLVFFNDNLQDPTNAITYIPNSYYVLGNDGNHFNKALIDPTAMQPDGSLNGMVSDEMAQALFEMSDHYPVVMGVHVVFPSGMIPPTNIVVDNTTDAATSVSWDNVTGANAYVVEYREQGANTWSSNNTSNNSITLNGLEPCTTYEYQIATECLGSGNSAFSSMSTFTTTVNPPNNINHQNVTAEGAELNWGPVFKASGYIVSYQEVGGNNPTAISLATNTLNLTNLTPCTTYEYWLSSTCAQGGQSDLAMGGTFTTLINVPNNIIVDHVAVEEWTLSWDVVTGASAYIVEYQEEGTSNWISMMTATNNINVNGLMPCTTYDYRIAAECSAGGISDFSTIQQITTTIAVPINVLSSNPTTNSTMLSWDVVTGASAYIVEYQEEGTSNWVSTMTATNDINVNGLLPCTTYDYRIAAECANGSTSDFSTIQQVNTTVDIPINLLVNNTTENSAILDWDMAMNADSYVVDYRILGDANWTTTNASTNTIELTDLVACTDYEYRVASVCANSMNSSFSNSVPFSTINCVIPITIKVYLQGAYDASTQLMNTHLASQQLLPTNQPYTATPWNYSGTETIADLNLLPNNIVDWLLVEVHADTNPDLLSTQAALLLDDGSLIHADGTVFSLPASLTDVNGYIVIRHRNHLDIWSSQPLLFTAQNPLTVDFTDNSTGILGGVTNQMITIDNQRFAMVAGDINGDGTIGTADFNDYRSLSNSQAPYNSADINLDGQFSPADFTIFQPNISWIGVSSIRY